MINNNNNDNNNIKVDACNLTSVHVNSNKVNEDREVNNEFKNHQSIFNGYRIYFGRKDLTIVRHNEDARKFIDTESVEGFPENFGDSAKNEETVRQNSMNIENLNEVNFPIEGQSEKPHIYSFDHGNHTFYKTTDESPVLSTDRFVEKTHQAATRFWAEIFSTIHIGITFVTAFILQLFKFILCSVVRPLTVGVIQLTADYFIKPVLMITFNGLIQPVLIFLYNIATSFRDVCKPIAEALGYFLSEVAGLCRAIRLVEIHK
ncbi:uncharacterized protein LOC130665703 isoform X2 [Microplitis mediator]|uniref:uncharacterized protein LOC130665703 isoform X2 n=1 Tax=Microplitis mediator TaxID=375433 RepID=UPI0025540D9E|nr:uncharacterized protein LOC130665703 isoform X2 [Microplitis mediator]